MPGRPYGPFHDAHGPDWGAHRRRRGRVRDGTTGAPGCNRPRAHPRWLILVTASAIKLGNGLVVVSAYQPQRQSQLMAAQRDAPPDVLWRPQPNSAVQILLDEAREQAEAAGVTVECLAWTRPARSPPEPVVDRPGELPFLSLVLPPVGSKGAIRKRSTGGSFVRTPRLLARRHEGPSPDGQYAKSLESAAVKDFSLLRGPRGLRPGRTYEVPLVKVRRWRRRTLSASGRSRRVESRPRPAEARPGRLPLPRGRKSEPGSGGRWCGETPVLNSRLSDC